MRRTLRSYRLPTAAGRPGRILVATSFLDPARGRVRCAAAPQLAADLASRPGAGAVDLGPAPEGGSGVLFAVSYADRHGVCGGLGVAAHRDDPVGVRAAEQTVARWADVVRSRRLLVADSGGLCWGGRRLLRLAETAARQGPVFMIGRPVAGPAALDHLAATGVRTVRDLDEVPDHAQVVFPAHGVPLGVRVEAAARGLTVLDGTCPLVAAAHADAAGYAARGDTVVVIGRPGHAAVPVLTTYAAAGAEPVVVASRAGAESVAGPGIGEVSFVVDPAMPVEEVMPVVAGLRHRFPRLAGHHFDALCDVASDGAQVLASVASACDLMLIVAGGADAEAESAARAVTGRGSRVRLVTRPADLERADLAEATSVGLAAVLTAPEDLAGQVMELLAGLGPLSVRHRGVRTAPAAADDVVPS
jgi:4-hydroxy-3-methylbut-2-enyl diphosphate reductase